MYHMVLADDSQTIQKVVRLTFAGEDCAIHCFSNGPEALDYIQAAGADIVLADADLPNLDGYSLCRELKSSTSTAHIPVLLLTAAFVPLDREKADIVRVSASISKPFEPNELVKLVQNLIQEQAPVTDILDPEDHISSVDDFESPEFPGTFMSLPRPPVEGELLFELTPEQCEPTFPVLRRKVYSRFSGESASIAEEKSDRSNVDLLVKEVEDRLRDSLRGIVSQVAREYLEPKPSDE